MNKNLIKAQQFRRDHNLVGGVVVVHNGEVNGWMSQLRNLNRHIAVIIFPPIALPIYFS